MENLNVISVYTKSALRIPSNFCIKSLDTTSDLIAPPPQAIVILTL